MACLEIVYNRDNYDRNSDWPGKKLDQAGTNCIGECEEKDSNQREAVLTCYS